ncbi:MAG: transcriptional regulator [Pirellula sp.]|nr:transcriptional regulator [Pirellula sp.]
MRPARAGQPNKSKPSRKSTVTSDRFATLNAFVDFAMARLTRAELAVWLVLYRDTRHGVVQASVENIAERAGVSRHHTCKAIGKLIDRSLLERVRSGALNQGAAVYRVRSLPNGGKQTRHP